MCAGGIPAPGWKLPRLVLLPGEPCTCSAEAEPPSATSLARALFNTVTAEATEHLWLEMFYHLLSGALSLSLSTAEKRGKVCLQGDLDMCEGAAATHPCFSGWKGRTYCLFSPVANCRCVVGQLCLPLFSHFLRCWLFRTRGMVLSCTLPSTHGILVHKTAPSAINTRTTVRRCRKSRSSRHSGRRGSKTLSRIY